MRELSLTHHDADVAIKALHYIVIEAEGGRLMMDKQVVGDMRLLMEKLIGRPCSCLWCMGPSNVQQA